MKPVVCVKCRLFYKIRKSGAAIEEGMPDGAGGWKPYKLWMGDVWACAGCGDEIVRGFGQAPIAEHYQKDYAEKAAQHAPLFRVDDC